MDVLKKLFQRYGIDIAVILALLEVLLPILIELLEDSPEDKALVHLNNPGFFVKRRIKAALNRYADPIADAAIEQLKAMSDDEKRELIAMAKAAKANRG